jgi:cytochrome c oxidase assembly factor CtaG
VSPDASWSFAPGVLIALAIYLAVYLAGWRRGRSAAHGHRPGFGRLALFGGGLVAILAALCSPVDRLGEQLLVMHMVQHVLLLDVAPILMILGLTKVILRPLTRRITSLERRAGPLGHPVFAAFLYAAVMLAWHIPALYDAALRHSGLHVLEHLCFGAAGLLYWWHLLSPIRSRMRLGGLGPVVYMASTKAVVGLLGIGLTFATATFYPFYEHLPRYWNLSAHDDQALAGAVMALEQSLIMGVGLVVLLIRALNESERESLRRERLEAAEADL